MARVTALSLRDAAREAMLAAGGRGFVRFLPPGGALLVTDAGRRCTNEDENTALVISLERAGFTCFECGGLLELTPQDNVLCGIGYHKKVEIDWSSPLHPVQALGRRWHDWERIPLSDAGRQLVLEALRLSWQPAEKAQDGAELLRAQGAVMQRKGDTSGMHEAGAILLDWCDQWK